MPYSAKRRYSKRDHAIRMDSLEANSVLLWLKETQFSHKL
jgi:hypothetical protein